MHIFPPIAKDVLFFIQLAPPSFFFQHKKPLRYVSSFLFSYDPGIYFSGPTLKVISLINNPFFVQPCLWLISSVSEKLALFCSHFFLFVQHLGSGLFPQHICGPFLKHKLVQISDTRDSSLANNVVQDMSKNDVTTVDYKILI